MLRKQTQCFLGKLKLSPRKNRLTSIKKELKTLTQYVKIQKMLNLLVFLEPSFVNTVLKMTNQQIKHLSHMFLRKYIIDNQDFSSYLF